MQAMNAVAAGFAGPWQTLGQFTRTTNPRYNEFSWEAWHECEVFRARVEAKLK